MAGMQPGHLRAQGQAAQGARRARGPSASSRMASARPVASRPASSPSPSRTISSRPASRRIPLAELTAFALAGVVLGAGLIVGAQYLGQDARARTIETAEWAPLAAPVSRLSEKGDPLAPLIVAPAPQMARTKVARAQKSDPMDHALFASMARPAAPDKADVRIRTASLAPDAPVAPVRPLRRPREVARRRQLSGLLRTPPIWKLESNWKLARSERLRLLRARKKRLREHVCLAKAIYFEARSESRAGQMAVAKVVLNRVRDPRFPNSICGVVYQNAEYRNACQFSFACDGRPDYPTNRRQWRVARQIAAKALKGQIRMKALDGVAYYHADYVRPRWASAMRRVVKIGRHIFYRDS